MKFFLFLVFLLIAFYAYEFSNMYYRIQVGKEIANETIPYSQSPESVTSKILIIGDSTAFGTGALDNKESIAGRVGSYYPNSEIVNLGRNGMRADELVQELDQLKDQSFDLVMLHIGGNDIVRFTNLEKLEQSIDQIFSMASSMTSNITITVTGNMGTATLFPYGTGWILEKRTRQVHALFKQAASTYNAQYVNLFLEREEDPFAKDPKFYYARDIFHPSGNGYGLWFESISKALDKIKLN